MKYVLIAGGVILIVFLGILSFIPIGIEPLTEVYFENHTKLPINIFPNEEYNFSFTTRNLEHQKMGYNYTIRGIGENLTLPIKEGYFEIEHNESITFFQKFSFERGFGRRKVQIEIEKIKH
jgi:hypothetical protein